MTDGLAPIDSLDHILTDYPVSDEETVSKRYNFFYDLGSGAYATVKYATCTKTNDAYAIKIISKTKTPRDYLKKFVPREVDALKKLSIHEHPNIAQMREFFETTKRIYLVTNLAMGGDLLTFINSRKYLNEDTSKKMIAQLLCALDHIHELGIVHRDLKCENLLIGHDDSLIVSDFGFATQQPKNRLLTTFCGSYAYAAPEILTGSSYNGKCTDVWSVGVIMYAMLNGKLPYNDTKPKNILVKIKSQPLTMVRKVSVACETFLRNILTISSMERPTVSDLIHKTWIEPTIERLLKYLPEKLQPSSFKLILPHKSSFRMSDSSEECLKIFTPRQPRDKFSPQLPINIANDIIAETKSHQTSSTISERVKQKYNKMKSDLRTWASRKRKSALVSPRFANIDESGKGRPTTGKLMRISQPKQGQDSQDQGHQSKMKYALPESNPTWKSSAKSRNKQPKEYHPIRMRNAVFDTKQQNTASKQTTTRLKTTQLLYFATNFQEKRSFKTPFHAESPQTEFSKVKKPEERSSSAVPTPTVTLFERRHSQEYRAKSCYPEGKLVSQAGSKATRRSSGSSSTSYSPPRRNSKKSSGEFPRWPH